MDRVWVQTHVTFLAKRGSVFLAILFLVAQIRSVVALENVPGEGVIDVMAAGYGLPMTVRYSPDGERIAVATSKGVILYDAITLDEMWSEIGVGAENIAFSPDSSVLAAVFDDNSVPVFNVVDGSRQVTFTNPGEAIRYGAPLVFSPDGSLLVSGTDAGRIRIWRLVGQTVLYTFAEHHAGIASLAFSNDGETLTSADGGILGAENIQRMAIRVWRVSDGMLLRTIEAKATIFPIMLSAGGSVLIGIAPYVILQEWQITPTGLQPLKTLDSQMLHYNLKSGALTGDEAMFAVATGGNFDLRIWSTVTGMYTPVLTGHTDDVTSIAFSPDSKTVISVSADGTVRLNSIS